MGLWIGRPGYLREFTEAASTFDRSPDLSVSEFQSLAGGVTTWAAPLTPRRYKLAWSSTLPDDLAHLDRLARRVDGPGPVALIDPAAGNLLTANHAVAAGADCVYPLGAPTDDLRVLAAELPVPVNAVSDAGSPAPGELAAAGARRVTFGGSLALRSFREVAALARGLRET